MVEDTFMAACSESLGGVCRQSVAFKDGAPELLYGNTLLWRNLVVLSGAFVNQNPDCSAGDFWYGSDSVIEPDYSFPCQADAVDFGDPGILSAGAGVL